MTMTTPQILTHEEKYRALLSAPAVGPMAWARRENGEVVCNVANGNGWAVCTSDQMHQFRTHFNLVWIDSESAWMSKEYAE